MNGQALFYDTLFRLFYPYATFFRNSILSGDFPFWNPFLYSGVPFFANLQSALLYPFTYLHLLWTFPNALLINTMIHTILAAIFMFLLARDLKFSKGASLLSGLIFSFNGYFVGHYAYPSHFNSYIWLPLILLFLRRSQQQFWANAGWAAVAVTLQIFAGHPQFVFYTGLVLFLEILSPGLLVGKVAPKRKNIVSVLTIVGLLTFLWSAVQLISTLHLGLQAPRTLSGGYEWATTYSLKPSDLLKMLSWPLWNQYFKLLSGDPNIMGIYFGIPILGLALWGGLKGGRKWLVLRRQLTLITGIGLLLALGGYLPFYRQIMELIPPLKLFRFPAQASYLACFGIALLSAMGLDCWKPGNKTMGFVVGLCILDLWVFSWKSISTIDKGFYSAQSATVDFLKGKAENQRLFLTPMSRQRALTQQGKTSLEAALKFHDALLPNLAMVYGFRDVEGYEELRYKKYDDILDAISVNPLSPWLDALGVKYLLSYNDKLPSKYSHKTQSTIHVFENPEAIPLVYVPKTVLSLSEKEIFSVVNQTNRFEFRDLTFLSETPVESSENTRSQPQPTLAVKEQKPGFFIIETDGEFPHWVVFSESYDEGWSAFVNGKKTDISKANLVQMAVPVPAGSSLVELKYGPPHFFSLVLISTLSFFMFWGVVGIFFRKRSPSFLEEKEEFNF